MYYLTNKQIELVISEVTNADITFSHLKDDLIDHICCEIENEISKGNNFENAFQKIKITIGTKNLKKVQENTLLLIDTKYKIMKTTMKTSGLASMIFLAFGALFKIMHWPGASVLLVFGFFSLILLFLPISLWVMRKESKLKQPILLYVTGFLGSVFVSCGFLFKIMHWPGANPLLIMGYGQFCLLFMPTLLYSLYKNEQNSSFRIAYLIGIFSFTTCLVGDLFKIMHWPGAGVLLLFGTIILVSIFLPYYAYIKYKDSTHIAGSFVFLSLGILLFTFFNNLLAMNLSRNVLSQFVSPAINAITTNDLIIESNRNLFNSFNSDTTVTDNISKTKINEIKKNSDELCIFIKKLQIKIISSVDAVDKIEAEKRIDNPSLIVAKDNYDIPSVIMIGADISSGKGGLANELKIKIQDYKSNIINLTNNSKGYNDFMNRLFMLEQNFYNTKGEKTNWEMKFFHKNIAISSITILANLSLNVRLIESAAISELSKKKCTKS